MRLAVVALFVALSTGCADDPPPPPAFPTYDDLVAERYCQALWARGQSDDQRHTCRTWYGRKMASERVTRPAIPDPPSSRPANALAAGLKAMGDGLQGNRSTNCTSQVVGSTVYTNCY